MKEVIQENSNQRKRNITNVYNKIEKAAKG